LNDQLNRELSNIYALAHHHPTALSIQAAFDEKTIKKIAKQYFDENGNPVNEDIWEHNYKQLSKAIDTGYKTAYDKHDVKMLYELKNNVAVFSAFKAYRMGKDVSHLLVDENGERKSWSEFYKDYKKVDGKYNSQWLAAEYDMATKQAHAAADWQVFERDKEVYPNLKYMPSMANEPRVDHEHYYGLVAGIDDPVWNNILPPSVWGCQCYVEQTYEPANNKVNSEETLPPPKGIVGNPGKTGMIFSPEHPYVSQSRKDADHVKEAFDILKPALDKDVITYKGGKGKVEVSLNADPEDYLKNFDYARTVVDNHKGKMLVRTHLGEGKKPEYEWNGVVGDRTQMDSSKNDCSKYVGNSFKDKYGKDSQLRGYNNSFIALDFNGKLDASQVFDITRRLNGEFKQKTLCDYVILRNDKNTVFINRTDAFNEIYDKIKKELLK